MRIRVRVTAPVEMLRSARPTSGSPIRTGAEPKMLPRGDFVQQTIHQKVHRDGVVYRLSGGENLKAPAQPVNNAGEPIQESILRIARTKATGAG